MMKSTLHILVKMLWYFGTGAGCNLLVDCNVFSKNSVVRNAVIFREAFGDISFINLKVVSESREGADTSFFLRKSHSDSE